LSAFFFGAVDGMVLSLCGREYNKREREESPPQRGAGDITKGRSVTYTLSDGKKIQKVTDVVTGTESVVRAVSPRKLEVLQGEISRIVIMSKDFAFRHLFAFLYPSASWAMIIFCTLVEPSTIW